MRGVKCVAERCQITDVTQRLRRAPNALEVAPCRKLPLAFGRDVIISIPVALVGLNYRCRCNTRFRRREGRLWLRLVWLRAIGYFLGLLRRALPRFTRGGSDPLRGSTAFAPRATRRRRCDDRAEKHAVKTVHEQSHSQRQVARSRECCVACHSILNVDTFGKSVTEAEHRVPRVRSAAAEAPRKRALTPIAGAGTPKRS